MRIKAGPILWVIIFLVVVQWCPVDVHSQDLHRASVTLMSGNKIDGHLVGSLDEDHLHFQLMNDQTIRLNYADIRKLKFYHTDRHRNGIAGAYRDPDPLGLGAFYHEIHGGLLFGEEHVGYALQTVNGYQLHRYFGAGIGLGAEHYENYTTLPLFAQIRGYLKNARFTPWYFAGIGYGFAWNNGIDEFNNSNMRTTGGMHWQAGIGYRINFNKVAFTVNLGYRNQRVKSEYTYVRPWDISDVEITEKRNLRRFVLSMGITL